MVTPIMKKNLVAIILVITWTLTSADKCNIAQLVAKNVTSTSLQLKWAQHVDCKHIDYSIQVESWVRMACDHVVPLSNEDMIKIDQNVNDDSALITGLEPFSKYTFAVHQNLISHSIEVVTLSERPQTKPNEGHADPQIQSINFRWDRVDPRLNKTLCQNQKGQMDGYYVKLIGPTEAGPYGLVSEKNLSDITPHYLVNGLLPYTKYKLEVYVKNSNGLYNPDLALEIFGQTKPYIPNPPKETKATPLSPSSIWITWQPNDNPPTGQIEKYEVRYGLTTSSVYGGHTKPSKATIVWQTEIEVYVNNETNSCSELSAKHKFVCHTVNNLEANTTYFFQVKAFNLNVSTPSNHSTIFKATTDPIKPKIPPTIIPSKTTKRPQRRPKPDPVIDNGGQDSGGLNTQVVLIIVSLLIIMVLICVVAFLVYKVKMHKLTMQYEARARQLQTNALMANHGVNLSPHRNSVIGGGSYCPQSYNQSIADTTITTIDWLNTSVNFNVESIQRRKLPEPPKVTSEAVEDTYENASIDSPDLLREIQQEIPSVMPVTSTPRWKQQPPLSYPSSPGMPGSKISGSGVPGLGTPEVPRQDHYLRPTFPEQIQPSVMLVTSTTRRPSSSNPASHPSDPNVSGPEVPNPRQGVPTNPRPNSCEDMDGYLMPTFPEQPPTDAIPIDNGFSPNIFNATVIPTESYVTSVSLQPQRTTSPTPPMASTDATPLI